MTASRLELCAIALAVCLTPASLPAQQSTPKPAQRETQDHNHELFDAVANASRECGIAWDAQDKMKPLLQTARVEKDRAKLDAALIEAQRLLGDIWLHLGSCRADLREMRSAVSDAHAPKP